jgi:hypothetical protein
MTERETGTEIMMELPEQSVELVKVFIETSKIFLFFFSTRQPKNLKPAAQIQLKKYSSRDSVPLKCPVFRMRRSTS